MLLLLLSRFSRVRLCATPRRQPTRLPHPWDSPGKNTGVGCHFLLQCMKVKSESEVAQSCPTLSDPMDYGWTAAYQAPPSMESSRQEYCSGLPFPSPGDPLTQELTRTSSIGRQILYHLSYLLSTPSDLRNRGSFSILVSAIEHFPGGSVVKNPPANTGDVGSVAGLGKSPGEGNGNPLQ